MHHKKQGFTLIETLLALFIISVLFVSVMKGLGTHSKTLFHIENKTIATWVAHQEMNKTLLQQQALQTGRFQGTKEQGGRVWHWLKKVAPSQFPGVLRIEIEVATEKDNNSIVRLEFFKLAEAK